MKNFVDKAVAHADQAMVWIQTTLISYDTLGQLGVILFCAAVAYGVVSWLRPRLAASFSGPAYPRLAPIFEPLYLPLLWLLLVDIVFHGMQSFEFPVYLLGATATLLGLWLVIRLAANVIRNPDLARLVTTIAWAIAALNIAGFLEPMLDLLDDAAITVGSTRISALAVLIGILTLMILIWAALFIARLLEQSLGHVSTLTSSAQVLLGKLTRIILITIAVLLAISSTGIDLTALAVFGGAIGVGIGFGLQKVMSNLISGLVLLLDSSIKPGDVVEVGGTYGWINKLAARYTSVITRDGREMLIPNEDMITQPVINWTYSDSRVRRGLPVSVPYTCDLNRAMELTMEAAAETERVLKLPKPNCLIKAFGDSAIELELRMWIEDPQNGVANVASNVYLKIWEKFKANDIKFPYPQHDVHLVSTPALADAKVRESIAAAWAAKGAPSPDD